MLSQPAVYVIASPQTRARVARLVEALPVEQVWDVVIRPHESRRSIDANRRLWALHQLAAQHTGHSVEEMHEMMKRKFLPRRKVTMFGEDVEIAGSSSKLPAKEFRDFMDAVEAFYISELSVFLGDG